MDIMLLASAGLTLLIGLTLSAVVFRLGPFRLFLRVGKDDEITPTDVDERTLRLADEVDRLQDEADSLAAELVKERATVAMSARSLRAFISHHGDVCLRGRECSCAIVTDAKAALEAMDIDPGKSFSDA